MRNTKVFIDNNRFTHSVEIWMRSEDGNRDVNYTYQDGEIVCTSIDRAAVSPEELKPFLKLPIKIAEDFISLLVDEAKFQGISIKQENIMQGKLEEKDNQIKFLTEQLEKFINKATIIK